MNAIGYGRSGLLRESDARNLRSFNYCMAGLVFAVTARAYVRFLREADELLRR